MEGLGSWPPNMREEVFKTMSNPAKMNEAMEKMGIDTENFGKPDVPRDETIAAHRKAVRSMENDAAQNYVSVMMSTHSISAHKPKSSDINPKSLLPIYFEGAFATPEGGTNYKGRKIRCTVIEFPLVVQSLMTIVEDDAGDVRKLSVYNLPFMNDPNIKGMQKLMNAARKQYPIGTRLEIIEPFFKMFRDGTYGFRVDEPSEILVLAKKDDNNCLGDWKLEGNCLFAKSLFKEASVSYSQAFSATPALVPVLLNMSFVMRKIDIEGRNLHGLQAAVAAFAIVSGSKDKSFMVKARLRVSQALACLGHSELSEVWSLSLNKGGTKAKKSSLFKVCLEDVTKLFPEKSFFDWDSFPAEKTDGLSLLRQKKLGNELVAAGRYELALNEYAKGFSVDFRQACAKVLSNRAAAAMKEKDYIQAMQDSTCAIFFDTGFEKAHNRRAIAATALDWSKKVLEFLFAEDSTTSSLLQEHQRIKRKGERVVNQKDGKLSQKELERMMYPNDDAMGSDQLSMMMNMMEMAVKLYPEKAQSLPQMFDSRIAPIHLDFFREGCLPKLVPFSKASEILRLAYEQTKSTPLSTIGFTAIDLSGTDSREINKRVRGDLRTKKWLCDPSTPIGAVRFTGRGAYNSCMFQRHVYHSWSNTSRVPFSPAKRHVAVGFVDLGELLTARISSYPLKWVGFESSFYSVAKSLVILELLSSSASPEVILEVWFSSSWGKSTYERFCAALRQVLAKTTAKSASKEVIDLLKLWSSAGTVDLSTARKKWLEGHEGLNDVVCNLLEEPDRLAACAYFLSGDLNISDPEVGSTVMHVFPPLNMTLALDESVFESADLEAVLALHREEDCQDIVVAWKRYHVGKIEKLMALVSSGEIEIELHHSAVATPNIRTLEKIREFNPLSMSWSNVCDYMQPAEFHALASSLSCSETRHFLLPMNWHTEVKGSCLLDYFHDVGKKESIIVDCDAEICREYGKNGFDRHFLTPPACNVLNKTGGFLLRNFLDNWLTAFFSEVDIKLLSKKTVVYSAAMHGFSETFITFLYMK